MPSLPKLKLTLTEWNERAANKFLVPSDWDEQSNQRIEWVCGSESLAWNGVNATCEYIVMLII